MNAYEAVWGMAEHKEKIRNVALVFTPILSGDAMSYSNSLGNSTVVPITPYKWGVQTCIVVFTS